MHSSGMKSRTLGREGDQAGIQGLGLMGMSGSYGPADEKESISTIRMAVALGVSLFDTADVYGSGRNEELLGKALKGISNDVLISTKCGLKRREDDGKLTIDGSPKYIKQCCEASLKRLGAREIGILFLHRVDNTVPVEESVGALSDLVIEGKVRHIGVSEAKATNVRAAHGVHPLAAVQSEYSLWSRDIEEEVLPTCRELGIALMAYAPLGKGYSTGTASSGVTLSETDSRRRQPRFQQENLARNSRLFDHLRRLATLEECSPSQLSLAWLHSRGEDIFPIPGTRSISHLKENVEASKLQITSATMAQLELLFRPGVVAGDRHLDMTFVNR